MQVYLVGGAVRDHLLGHPYHEKDYVVVGATPQQMLAQGFQPVGKDFPVFLHPETKDEYALARTERKSGHGYHGFEFHTDASVTLEQDLIRRDLTINAMALDDDGNFAKLPENIEDMYQQRIPVSKMPVNPPKPAYQAVPSGGAQQQPAVQVTPVAIEPAVKRQVVTVPNGARQSAAP